LFVNKELPDYPSSLVTVTQSILTITSNLLL
jgi:hypothetical protein